MKCGLNFINWCMYFFKIEPLKQKLRDGVFTDREALPYLIGWIVFSPLTLGSKLNFAKDEDLLLAFLGIFATIFGPWFVYKENSGAVGNNFIQKFIVLGWVVYCRLALVFIGFFLVAMIPHLFGHSYLGHLPSGVKIVIFVLYQYCYFNFLGAHIRDVATIQIEHNKELL